MTEVSREATKAAAVSLAADPCASASSSGTSSAANFYRKPQRSDLHWL